MGQFNAGPYDDIMRAMTRARKRADARIWHKRPYNRKPKFTQKQWDAYMAEKKRLGIPLSEMTRLPAEERAKLKVIRCGRSKKKVTLPDIKI